MLNCNMMIRSLRHVKNEARELPTDKATTNEEDSVDCGKKVILEWKQYFHKQGCYA